MTSISLIPPELALCIIEYLRPYIAIGTDDYLRDRDRILKRWNDRRLLGPGLVPPRPDDPTLPELQSDSYWDTVDSGSTSIAAARSDRGSNREYNSDSTSDANPLSRYSSLKALRLTNRHFYRLCTPFLCTELNIFPNERSLNAASSVLTQHAGDVRFLRIIVTNTDTKDHHGKLYNDIALESLNLCRNATSLAVYFDESLPFDAMQIATKENLILKICQLISTHSLHSLDVGCVNATTSYYPYSMPTRVETFLLSVGALLGSSKSLKALEIAARYLSTSIYDTIRANGVYLQSLGFHSSLGAQLGRVWDPEQINKWAPNSNLTRLNLINCSAVYAPHVPELVRHFSSLKHLFVSACGGYSDTWPYDRDPGWSKEPNALWRRREPLHVFHIEHMAEWEILAMGTIPAKTIIATGVLRGDLARSFLRDDEIFPCLTVVKLEYEQSCLDDVPVAHGQQKDWRQVLISRGIIRQWNAKWLIYTQ